MSAVIFDGKSFVKDREVALKIKIVGLGGVKPKLASILASNDPASKLYVNLKKKAAERLGAEVEIYTIHNRVGTDHIVRLIKYLNTDPETHGIMVQLPLPKRLKEDKKKIINAISPTKDVDGMRASSPFVHPTAKAAVEIVEEGMRQLKKNSINKIAVVGASGMVGSAVVDYATTKGFKVQKFTNLHKGQLRARGKTADAMITATGKPSLIESDVVKKGAIVVDVGSPKGDIDFVQVKKDAGFVTPVPGGVGPVTIFCLLENLVVAAYNTARTHTEGTSS